MDWSTCRSGCGGVAVALHAGDEEAPEENDGSCGDRTSETGAGSHDLLGAWSAGGGVHSAQPPADLIGAYAVQDRMDGAPRGPASGFVWSSLESSQTVSDVTQPERPRSTGVASPHPAPRASSAKHAPATSCSSRRRPSGPSYRSSSGSRSPTLQHRSANDDRRRGSP